MFQPPLSRQPSCRYCAPHEEHLTRCLLEVDGAMCPCPPHAPIGQYESREV